MTAKYLFGAVAGLSAAAMAPAEAAAATLLFDYRSTDDLTLSFELDSEPVPAFDEFAFEPMRTVINGAPVANAFVAFFDASEGGGFTFGDRDTADIFDLFGPQLFTGTSTMPRFSPGTFTLNEGLEAGAGVLTISPAMAGAIPEPASWALLVLGFGAIGGALRSQRRRVTVSYA